MMEAQLNMVEQRLQRREKELISQIDESKINSKLERSRLIAQHDQELMEKDEQLLRFQNEMEYLVQMFRANSNQQILVE